MEAILTNAIIIKLLAGIALTVAVIGGLMMRKAETENRDAQTLQQMRQSFARQHAQPSGIGGLKDWKQP
jgi:hypothetical protein